MYFTLRKHQFSYTFMSCKIVPSALPHCENSNGFLTKAIKEKKKYMEINNNFPKRTYLQRLGFLNLHPRI